MQNILSHSPHWYPICKGISFEIASYISTTVAPKSQKFEAKYLENDTTIFFTSARWIMNLNRRSQLFFQIFVTSGY